MARFKELLRFALAKCGVEDGFIQQISQTNRGEINLNMKIYAELYLLLDVSRFAINKRIPQSVNSLLSYREEVTNVNFNKDIILRRLEEINHLTDIKLHTNLGKGAIYADDLIDAYNEIGVLYGLYRTNHRDRANIVQPDLFLHHQFNRDHQLFIAEIKVGKGPKGNQKDICKLYAYLKVLGYKDGYFISLQENDKDNLKMLQNIAIDLRNPIIEVNIEYFRKIYVWYLYHGVRNNPRWICRPFTDICDTFSNGAGTIEDLNYNDAL